MRDQATTVAPGSATSSNTQPILSELAERAAKSYGQSTAAWLRCARVMLQAREIAEHGEWGRFLVHAGVPPRTARNMLRIADYAGGCPVKTETVSVLGVRGTLDFLTAVDHAMVNWRAARNAVKPGSELHRELIQSLPDSLYAVFAWVDSDRDRDAIRATCRGLGLWCPDADPA